MAGDNDNTVIPRLNLIMVVLTIDNEVDSLMPGQTMRGGIIAKILYESLVAQSAIKKE